VRVTKLGALLDDYLFRSTSDSDRDQKFEELMKAFLRTDELWSAQFDEVWSWESWPERDGESSEIDLVARERESGSLIAVLCAFHDPDSDLSKPDIDAFLSASNHAPFTRRLVIATTDTWDEESKEAVQELEIPVQRLGLADLLSSSTDWTKLEPVAQEPALTSGASAIGT
jgi:predicted helicase